MANAQVLQAIEVASITVASMICPLIASQPFSHRVEPGEQLLRRSGPRQLLAVQPDRFGVRHWVVQGQPGWYDGSRSRWSTEHTRQKLFFDKMDPQRDRAWHNFAPGISYSEGSGWELGIEAMIPTTKATGSGIGVIAQLMLQLDYLLPDRFIGRPIFPLH